MESEVKTATISLRDLKFLVAMAKKAAEDDAMGFGDESQATSDQKERLSKLRLGRIKRIQIHAKVGESDPFASVHHQSRVL
jgi:hypothetical protein